VDAITIYLSLAAACCIGLYISRIVQAQKQEKARLAAVAAQPSAEARRSHDTEDGLNAFIDEAEEILGLARNVRSESEDSGVEVLMDDYHNRLVLFLMKNMGSYFARRLHSHQGLRSFSSKAYPAYLSTERIRVCRHLETDILRLTSFLSLIDRPMPAEGAEETDEEPVDAEQAALAAAGGRRVA
jgi:hypothetical protein